MEKYIEDKKNLYVSIFEFLEGSGEYSNDEDSKESFRNLIYHIRSHQIEENEEEMHHFLEIIKNIGENHHRDHDFNERINHILEHYKEQIKQTLSNLEIFHIFENNKKIVHFLLKNDIITISNEIYTEMIAKVEKNGKRYWHFFIPELENFVGEELMEFAKNELLKDDPTFFTDYEKKRQEGENDSYICLLIRQDSVEEFIAYVNRCNISLYSQISPSIFETNSFLIDNKSTTLIEYAAFFGSIQIFRYLYMNNIELTPSLWLYAIHSNNAQLIYFLESNVSPPQNFQSIKSATSKVDTSSKNYDKCLIESIKCHHNDIADYIDINLINQTEKTFQQNNEIIANSIKYHNYMYFQIDLIIGHGFFYLGFYHYDKLFELLLKIKKKWIEKKAIKYPNISKALIRNEVIYDNEIIYHLLLKEKKITYIFNHTDIKQILIPPSITSIEENAFYECSRLTQITIPSSVTSIGNYVFYECRSLTQITIPSSVTSIGNYAFSYCSSLAQITIPSSLTSIGNYAFYGCSSLTQITIPSSVTSIGDYAFYECSRLTQITIPSSVTSIGNHAFYGCASLTQIKISTSVTSIENYTFFKCSSLTQITIPSSVTSIRDYAFSECSSLTRISIPSSVKSIGSHSFQRCLSLTQITIPSSVKSIKKYVFNGCSSLIQVGIPFPVYIIEEYAFNGCSSLAQIDIPCSVRLIKKNAFNKCPSLNQVSIPFHMIENGIIKIDDYNLKRILNNTEGKI